MSRGSPLDPHLVITCEVMGTLNQYKIVEHFFELCALRGGGDVKTFQLSLAPSSANASAKARASASTRTRA